MSQSKVDKKKYEKKHRKEILRKQKIKKIIAITVTIVVIAAIVGSVAGVKIYKIPKYVDASGLSEYVDKTWKDSGYDTLFSATASDAEDTADTTENAEDTAEATDAEEDTTADAE